MGYQLVGLDFGGNRGGKIRT